MWATPDCYRRRADSATGAQPASNGCDRLLFGPGISTGLIVDLSALGLGRIGLEHAGIDEVLNLVVVQAEQLPGDLASVGALAGRRARWLRREVVGAMTVSLDEEWVEAGLVRSPEESPGRAAGGRRSDRRAQHRRGRDARMLQRVHHLPGGVR